MISRCSLLRNKKGQSNVEKNLTDGQNCPSSRDTQKIRNLSGLRFDGENPFLSTTIFLLLFRRRTSISGVLLSRFTVFDVSENLTIHKEKKDY